MHLAQLNIARLKFPIDDPRVADFVDNLDRVNAAAERSEGFVWRLVDETGDAAVAGGFDDPMMVVNMSVWADAGRLEHFVWNTVHKRFYMKKGNWFEPMSRPHFVMWWVPAGHCPTPSEALARLEHLTQNGPSDHAFGWESLPSVERIMQQRCA